MNLLHSYTGGVRYYPDYQLGPHELIVAVPCRVGDLPTRQVALLETGSRWCILPPNVARDLGCELSPDPSVPPLHSR